MALQWQLTRGNNHQLTENDIFIASTLLMVTFIEEITEESIPVILKRFIIAEAINSGNVKNVKDYEQLLHRSLGLKINIAYKPFKTFIRDIAKWPKEDTELKRKKK